MPLAAALAAALAACTGLNVLIHGNAPPRPPDPVGLTLAPETAVETASLFSLGLRRLAADLNLIRLIIYYGSPEPDEEGEHHHHAFDPEHPETSYGGGSYPELGPRAKRVLDIDPSFGYAALFASGALAFNLNRPQEALEVLQYALKRDPKNVQFHLYIGAVGFQRHGDAASVIRLLEPTLASPDCPTMIKSMVAFLYKRTGQREKAVRLYREIIETSRDAGYRSTAERMLRELQG